MNESYQKESFFSALSDYQRRKIINLLKKKEMSVTEIKTHFDLSGATLSHHLSVLKKADLLRVRRKGQHRIYTLNMTAVEQMMLYMKELF